MSVHPSGVNHLAIATRDIKAQIEFFTDVLGCKLNALFWMYNVPDTYHCFIELNPKSYISFVQHPGNPDTVELGVTHPGFPGGTVAAGATQHIAFDLDSIDNLYVMRDRLRSKGIWVMGPLDHGTCESIYFAGPEGLTLEITAGQPFDPEFWIDPEVVALAGISEAELQRYLKPESYVGPVPAGSIAQPALDRSKPHMKFPDDGIFELTDEQIRAMLSHAETPVKRKD